MSVSPISSAPSYRGGRSDGGDMGPDALTDEELDQLEAGADANAFLPAEITRAIVRDERARRAHGRQVRHALAGYPLGRPQ